MFEINEGLEALLYLPPQIVFKRIKGSGRPMEEIIPDIAATISQWQSTEPLCHLVDPRQTIQLDKESLSQHINWLNQKAAESISKSFILFDGRPKSRVRLIISLGFHSNLERLQIPIDPNFLNAPDSYDEIFNVFTRVGQAFNAFTGYIYEEIVALWNEAYNLKIVDFDSSKVPYGVWWMNYWSSEQVKNVDLSSIVNLDWSSLVKLENNDIITSIISHRPNFRYLEDIQKFERIIQMLNLRKIQEQNKPSVAFKYDSLAT